MSRIVIAGAGVCGVGAAIMLARSGHDVTVVERDPQPQPADPEDAWHNWERRGVAQFRLGHILLARARGILDEEAPEVVDELRSLGALDVVPEPPPSLETWTPRDDDERFRMVTARRPVLDLAFANVADRTDGLTIRRGVPLSGLHVTGEHLPGVPHVGGVVTENGEIIEADVVIDGMGRRSPMLRWLEDIGAQPAFEQAVDSGFAYYGQYLQSDDGSLPTTLSGALTPFHGYSILTLPADNGTWFYGIYASSKDSEMRVLRERDALRTLMAACPLHAHWLEGREIGDPISMVGVTDRDRRCVVDGRPVVTGMLPLADAWACTNPSLGRGMSIGLEHARQLRRFLDDAPGDPVSQAAAWDEITHDELAPYHHATRATDQARAAELLAQQQGLPVEHDPNDMATQIRLAMERTMPFDEDVFRMFLEIQMVLDLPANIFSRPGALDHLIQASDGRPPIVAPGPTRAEFLEMLG